MKNVTQAQLQLNKMKFEEIFDSVEEAQQILVSLSDKVIDTRLKGQAYLHSFKNTLSKGGKLSDAQIKQLKRLCKEIAKGNLIQKSGQLI